jgi:hypothetical protein
MTRQPFQPKRRPTRAPRWVIEISAVLGAMGIAAVLASNVVR